MLLSATLGGLIVGLVSAVPSYFFSLAAVNAARRWSATRERLMESGVQADEIDRVHVPIGIDIGAETPDEIAVSVVAEMIAEQVGKYLTGGEAVNAVNR